MVQGVLGPGQHLGGPQPMVRAGLRGGQHRGQDQQSPEHTQVGQAYPSQALVPTEPPPPRPDTLLSEPGGAGGRHRPDLGAAREGAWGQGPHPPASRHNWGILAVLNQADVGSTPRLATDL